MADNENEVHPLVDLSATYRHSTTGLTGMAEDWSEDPDGKVKIRIKDAWLFLDDCTKEENAEVS